MTNDFEYWEMCEQCDRVVYIDEYDDDARMCVSCSEEG